MSATTQKKSSALMLNDSVKVLNAATPNRRSVNVRESIDGGTPKVHIVHVKPLMRCVVAMLISYLSACLSD